MAKIFLSFYNAVPKLGDRPGASPYYEGFVKGLVDAGNDVLVFQSNMFFNLSKDAEKCTRAIKKRLDEFSPDLIIAFNNYGPQYASMVDCPIIIYGVDSPNDYYNKDAIVANRGRFRFLALSAPEVEALKRNYGVKDGDVGTISLFSEVRAENVEQTIPISFIGSRFSGQKFHWNEFRNRQADYRSAQRYRQLLDILRRDPYFNWDELKAEFADLGLGIGDYHEIMRSLGAEKRIQVLSAVADFGLELFGTEEWFTCGGESSDLYCSYNPKRLYTLKQNQDLYNASKICLNVNHIYAVQGFAWRVCDIMASNGCLVSEWTPYMDKIFPGVPIPTFRNKYEAHEQCAKVLKDDKLREDVVAASQAAIEERFRFRHILPVIEEACGMSLRSDHQGKVSFVDVGAGTSISKPRTKFQVLCDLTKLMFAQIPGVVKPSKQVKLLDRINKYYGSGNNSSFRAERNELWHL